MKMKRLKQCLLLITILGGLSISEAYAQKNNFANLARYAKENAALPKPVKKEKRVVFMGNSITEGWVRTHPDFFNKWLYRSWHRWTNLLSILIAFP